MGSLFTPQTTLTTKADSTAMVKRDATEPCSVLLPFARRVAVASIVILATLAHVPPLWASEADGPEAEPEPPAYDVIPARGNILFSIDPVNPYKDMPRGTIDNEPMNEVVAGELPSTLPEPIVVPAADREYFIQLNDLEKNGPKRKGEDKIFYQIATDMEKERCLYLGDGCPNVEVFESVPRSQLTPEDEGFERQREFF